MTDHKMPTCIRIAVGDEGYVEYFATAVYAYQPGFAGDRTDPPHDATVELIDVYVEMPGRDPWKLGPPALIDALDRELQSEMMRHWADEDERGREWRAEQRRDAA